MNADQLQKYEAEYQRLKKSAPPEGLPLSQMFNEIKSRPNPLEAYRAFVGIFFDELCQNADKSETP